MSDSSSVTLVLGGTGRVGLELCRLLAAREAATRVLTREPKTAARSLPNSIELRSGSIQKIHDATGLFDDVTQMFLACGDAPNQAEIEIGALHAARDAGVAHVVKLSAHAAGWEPPLSVGIAHSRVERCLRNSGMTWTILRPVFFQQTLLMFADEIANKGTLTVPLRDAPVAYVDVCDVAAVADQALRNDQHAGQTYTLTGPSAVSIPQVLDFLGGLHQRTIRLRSLPAWVARLMLPYVSGMPRWQTNLIVDLMAKLELRWEAGVTSDVESVLNRPARPLFDTLTELADAFAPREA